MNQASFSLPPELLLPAGVLLWMCTCLGISLFSGWWDLGRVYRATRPFAGPLWRFQSAGLRWNTSYGGIVSIGVTAEGLYLSVLFLFRIAHPPLFIPWYDISAKPKKAWFVIHLVELRFRQVPDVPVYLQRRLADRIQNQVGPAWPGGSGVA
jgi:hypothetical protein